MNNLDITKLRRFAQYARRTLVAQTALKIGQVLSADSAARRESPQAVFALIKQVEQSDIAQVIDKVAYTWFNRFCALRFMDMNGYTRIRVVSPADEGQFQPEILADAKMGHMDEERVPEKTRHQVAALLSGSTTSRDPQQEAYRLLVVAECNNFYREMPYLFERIADYTELLIPDDLLSGNSMLAYTREALTPDACKDVEVIGWLYQFYISEKKDHVFDGLKKGRKISAEDIPAATQLFTPHWIVRYLVENSLGRLWMLNHPTSGLVEQMDYYIKPTYVDTDFLRIQRPEDIRICDPACGSGHMLTYAFDVLYAIYEEVGTSASDIPGKILTHNLYGIELDERAGNLAAFALTMKARAKQKRFFERTVEPNICVLQKVTFDPAELHEYMDAVGRDLFTANLRGTLQQFSEADNFGSLIRPKLESVNNVLSLLAAKDLGGQLFLAPTHDKILRTLRQADFLSKKYQVVVANPPYMGSKGMNLRLVNWAREEYPDSKSDLFAMFMERNIDLTVKQGVIGMITMQSWMFLSSFEKLRSRLLEEDAVLSMAHLGARAFDSIGGEVVSTTAFVLGRGEGVNSIGDFLRLTDGKSEDEKARGFLEALGNPGGGRLYKMCSGDFKKIPGAPIAYWVIPSILTIFESHRSLGEISQPRQGATTSNNNKFLRLWYEIDKKMFAVNMDSTEAAKNSEKKWFPYNKGGTFRRWFGNQDFVINYENDGYEIKSFHEELNKTSPGGRLKNQQYYFKPSVSWSKVSSGTFAVRYFPEGFIFDVAGSAVFFADRASSYLYAGLLNSKFVNYVLGILSPTLNFEAEHLAKIPIISVSSQCISEISEIVENLICAARMDWDLYETSWNFCRSPLLNYSTPGLLLGAAYAQLRSLGHDLTNEVQRNELENNRIFDQLYGLRQDELAASSPLTEISLTSNPHYRYGGGRSEEELEELMLSDSMREFVSYAVGCMFGRYSLDKPGLILASAGDTLTEYLRQVPHPSFAPDADNVIPLLDGDWFNDDATERFRGFLRLTFGDERWEENLRFIENGLGKDLRKYMVKDFYNDHVKRYKKRPIYWLFASPKGTFSALVYMHRYRPDTVSVVLKYLREFKEKLVARRVYLDQVNLSPNAGQGEKTKALKESESLKKQLSELDEYERDVLFPLARQQVPLNLDSGVKENYVKLGPALKKITGLDAKDED